MKCCRSLSIPGTGVSIAYVELLMSCSDINITINSIVHKNYDPELSANFTNLVTLPSSSIVGAMVIVWRIRGKIIRTVLCCVVYDSCTQ